MWIQVRYACDEIVDLRCSKPENYDEGDDDNDDDDDFMRPRGKTNHSISSGTKPKK